jgi:putative acetyltransferase
MFKNWPNAPPPLAMAIFTQRLPIPIKNNIFNVMNNTLRPAVAADRDAIIALYKKVTRISGGLARSEEEVTADYVNEIIEKSKKQSGIHFVMVQGIAVSGTSTPAAIIGEIHCYKPGLKYFDHLLSDLTIAVDPDFQGQGIGKDLFMAILSEVLENRKDILRVELITGETNKKAIAFYQGLGFTIEGRMPNRFKLGPADLSRIGAASPVFDADIPMAWMNPNFHVDL